MGFKRNWDINDIKNQLCRCAAEAISPHNDGWTSSDAKRDLVTIKYLLEDLLEHCPNFGDIEKGWEQERLITLLKRK